MFKHLYCFLYGILLSSYALSQTSTGDCEGAIPLCSGFYAEETAPPGAGNFIEWTGTCNGGAETMSLWYTFTVTEPGNLSFILNPNNPADDYDWGMFDITNGGCTGILTGDGSSPEVSCNSYGSFGDNGPTGISTASGGTGNSNGPGDLNGPAFNADLNVQVGQTFALVVMNWSQSLEGYTIDFSGSTADIYDDDQPYIVEATTNCNNNEAQIIFSEPIITSSVDLDDFSLTGPGGTYTCIEAIPDANESAYEDGFTLIFDASVSVGGTYVLSVSDVSGNVEDACGNQAVDAVFDVEFSTPVAYDLTIETACNGEGGSVSIDNILGGTEPFSLLLNGQPQPSLQASELTPGNYLIAFVDALDCASIQTIEVPNHDIQVNIPNQDSISCSNTVIEIQGVTIVPEQSPLIEWSYENADGSLSPLFSSALNPTVGASGNYQILVTDSASGCKSDAMVFIGQTQDGFLDLTQIQFPNIITPNGDSDNETWRPYLRNNPNLLLPSVMDEYRLTVFDRWGKIVFDSTTGKGNYWSVKEEADGTYFYELYYKITCGKVQEGLKTGHFQIIR
jgi:gliding motility-associated-like protein